MTRSLDALFRAQRPGIVFTAAAWTIAQPTWHAASLVVRWPPPPRLLLPCCQPAAAAAPAVLPPPCPACPCPPLQLFTAEPSVPVSSVGGPAGGGYAPPGSNGGATSPPLGFGGGPSNTLDEPVWDTIKRDLLRIYKNLVRPDGLAGAAAGASWVLLEGAARRDTPSACAGVFPCLCSVGAVAQWLAKQGPASICCSERSTFQPTDWVHHNCKPLLCATGDGGVPIQGPQPAVGGAAQLGLGEGAGRLRFLRTAVCQC